MNEKAPDGRQVRWREHNEARRQAIIDAAIAVLENQAPGEEISLQAVAELAGLSRTVIYRHFEDRADLDREVQRTLCARLGAELLPALAKDGTPDQIVGRIISAFVDWAVAHPSLIWFAERDAAGWGPSPIAEAMEAIAVGIEEIMESVVSSLGVDLDERDLAGLDPWVFGMISAVFGAVNRWMERDERVPEASAFAEILKESIWLQIDGLARARGINLPDLPVAALLQPLGGGDE